MANILVSGDPHIHHENILSFKRSDGSPLRDFKNIDEHDEYIIERHNSVVRPQDHWYCMGDCVMQRKYMHLLSRFNGHRRLVRGNHDVFKTSEYLKYFDEIYATRVLDDMIFSHIPLHPDNINKKFLANVHAHLHANSSPAGRYFSVSMEVLPDPYTPISLEDLKLRIKKIQNLDKKCDYEYGGYEVGSGGPICCKNCGLDKDDKIHGGKTVMEYKEEIIGPYPDVKLKTVNISKDWNYYWLTYNNNVVCAPNLSKESIWQEAYFNLTNKIYKWLNGKVKP